MRTVPSASICRCASACLAALALLKSHFDALRTLARSPARQPEGFHSRLVSPCSSAFSGAVDQMHVEKEKAERKTRRRRLLFAAWDGVGRQTSVLELGRVASRPVRPASCKLCHFAAKSASKKRLCDASCRLRRSVPCNSPSRH